MVPHVLNPALIERSTHLLLSTKSSARSPEKVLGAGPNRFHAGRSAAGYPISSGTMILRTPPGDWGWGRTRGGGEEELGGSGSGWSRYGVFGGKTRFFLMCFISGAFHH